MRFFSTFQMMSLVEKFRVHSTDRIVENYIAKIEFFDLKQNLIL